MLIIKIQGKKGVVKETIETNLLASYRKYMKKY
jgi:hypothetical protein